MPTPDSTPLSPKSPPAAASSAARRGLALLATGAVGAGLWLSSAGAADSSSWPPEPYPAASRVENAREFAAEAAGTVSFAVMDEAGGIRGLDPDRQYSSASASKVLLLAAELQRLRAEDEPLDEGTRSLLDSMITYSDNDAASSIYARVGDEGMERAARLAGMRSFEVTPGYWGGAQVTAADLARFYLALGRNLSGSHRDYGEGLLRDITESQRWGIPEGAAPRWTIYFKGGWRPAGVTENSGSVTHQAGLLRDRDGRELAIAVLTDLSPGSTAYGVISGITERLLADSPAPVAWPAN